MPVRLLIVDDNERFLAASRAILQRQGLEVIAVARSSAEGLLRAQLLRPDLVLVDIGLGEDSGFELVRQLASDDDTADLNVILISTQSEDDFAELIRESPAVGFVSKWELSRFAIEEVLRRFHRDRCGDAPG
ncbi:MAG TPA: response regulator transcription factor [Solirubrobacteraceae bacterium]|jgi:DNA-binding NarL/FixJ family response regulator